MDIRSYNSLYLDGLVERVKDIVKGAALMTGTTYEISWDDRFESKVPARHLNQLVMANAEWLKAPALAPAREKTGSTDFGNVTFNVPGTCLRMAFVDPGTPSHTVEWVEQGMGERAHAALLMGAKAIGMTVCDLIAEPGNLRQVQDEFRQNKAAMAKA